MSEENISSDYRKGLTDGFMAATNMYLLFLKGSFEEIMDFLDKVKSYKPKEE